MMTHNRVPTHAAGRVKLQVNGSSWASVTRMGACLRTFSPAPDTRPGDMTGCTLELTRPRPPCQHLMSCTVIDIMTTDLAAVSAAVDSAVPPALDAEWAPRRPARVPSILVHRRVHRTCGQRGRVRRPSRALLPAQPGRRCSGGRTARRTRTTSGRRAGAAGRVPRPHRRPGLGRGLRPGHRGPSSPATCRSPAAPSGWSPRWTGWRPCDDVVRDGLLRLKALGLPGRARRLHRPAGPAPAAAVRRLREGRLARPGPRGPPAADLATSRGARVIGEFVDSGDALAQCRDAGDHARAGPGVRAGCAADPASVRRRGADRSSGAGRRRDPQDRPLHREHRVPARALDLRVRLGDRGDRRRQPLGRPVRAGPCHRAVHLPGRQPEVPHRAGPAPRLAATLASTRSLAASAATSGTGSTPVASACRSSATACPVCPAIAASATRKPVASIRPP